MTTQDFELHLISHNPWQTRPLDENHAQALAADIAENGLLQPAVGRIHPDRPEYIQLAVGHHRLQAFRLLRQEVFDKHLNGDDPGPKWGALPVDIRELTDLQMAMLAVSENNARKDLSAIEKAQTLQRLIREFDLTQAAAGKPFGLSQSAVAQLLRLLKLPEPIQAHVQSGALPERLARQLVSVAKIFPAEALKIADGAAKADPDAREADFDNSRDELFRSKGVGLYNIPWKLDWPAKPIKVEGHKSISEIPACAGCEFHQKTDYGAGNCLRRECFEQKKIEHAWTTVAAGAKKAGLPAAQRAHPMYPFTDLIPMGVDEKYLERALKAKVGGLVVVPAPHAGDWQSDRVREKVTGSKWLTVATIRPAELEAAVPKPKEAKPKAAKPERDWKAENDKHDAMRKQADELFDRAAPYLAKALPFGDLVVRLLVDTLEIWTFEDKFKKAKLPAERARLWVRALLDHKLEFDHGNDPLAGAREIVSAVARAFQAKLPAGWDGAVEPPPAPKPKTPNARAAASAAARAQVLRTAKPGHVRRHTQPAPKPSAAKKTRRKTAKKGK